MQNEVVVERDLMVTMRDGIKLACDVYRPARDGQPVTGAFPVIISAPGLCQVIASDPSLRLKNQLYTF